MFQTRDGSGIELTTPKRYYRVQRTRAEKTILRDKAITDLIDQLGWKVADVADAFRLHRDTVYESANSFRQLVREIANRC
jgi:hypothetical protein